MHSFIFLLFWVHLFLFFNSSFPSLSTPDFPASNLTLHGDAHFRNNAISLTQEHMCPPSPSSSATSFGVGRAFYMYPIRFLDSSTNNTASFSCRFSFSIIPSPMCPFGDGIAFLITSNADSLSLSSGYMGLPGPALNPKDSFIAVEFDTSFDPSLDDISNNHIGVDVNTVRSFASVDVASKGVDLKSGKQMTAWIDYSDAMKLIQVWISYSQFRPASPVLEAKVDLSEHFKEYMHVGFSASNGRGSAVHIVGHWRFKTYGSMASMKPMNTIESGDCYLCSTEDSSKSDIFSNKRTKQIELALGLGGLAAFSLSIIAILVVIICFLLRKKRQIGTMSEEPQTYRANRMPTRLSIAEIKSATVGFHRSRILGEGASATVYKGALPSGGTVAVKRFDRPGIGCLRNPFITEFATMIGCLRHKNLIQLHGWCCEGSELVLVYEFMPNGSLDKVLHKKNGSPIFLSWKQRLNIVLGVASALAYLHEECERQIIHRDVKACNILLDAEFNAKLGDFGLAEVCEHSSMPRAAAIPAGTMGYLAPEYVFYGVPSEKTDVYSFGVVVLEVATGKRPVDDDGIVLVDRVWSYWEKGRLIQAADSKLSGKFNKVEMERMLMAGLACVHPHHERRPTIKVAARMIRGEVLLPLLPARKPKVGFQPIWQDDPDEEVNDEGDHSPGTDDLSWMTPRSRFF